MFFAWKSIYCVDVFKKPAKHFDGDGITSIFCIFQFTLCFINKRLQLRPRTVVLQRLGTLSFIVLVSKDRFCLANMAVLEICFGKTFCVIVRFSLRIFHALRSSGSSSKGSKRKERRKQRSKNTRNNESYPCNGQMSGLVDGVFGIAVTERVLLDRIWSVSRLVWESLHKKHTLDRFGSIGARLWAWIGSTTLSTSQKSRWKLLHLATVSLLWNVRSNESLSENRIAQDNGSSSMAT